MPAPDADKPINTPDQLDEAERFQRLFVVPMVEAVRVEVKALVVPLTKQVEQNTARFDGIEKDVNDLKNNQKKALSGYALYATGLSVLIGMGLDWVKRKTGLGGG